MLPKTSMTLQRDLNSRYDADAYAAIIATALKRELGGTHRAIKTIRRWTGAGERTAINWLAAEHGPSGPHLATLSRYSDAVLEAFLIMAHRERVVIDLSVSHIRNDLLAALAMIDDLVKADISRSARR